MKKIILCTILATGTLAGCQAGTDRNLITSALGIGKKKESSRVLESGTATEESGSQSEQSAEDLTALPQKMEKAEETQMASVDQTVERPETSGAIAAYVPPATGTVFTWRNNWASLPKVISYKVAGKVTIAGQEYIKFTSVAGLKNTTHAYYDTKNFNLKGYRDAKNAPLVSYKPVEERYRFPLKPGDKWVTSWKSMDYSKRQITNGGGIVQVIGYETLKLPAGTFKTVKVKMPLQRDAPRGMKHYVWFSPKLGITVREQIGNGSMNWTQVLEKIELPG